MCWRAQVQLSMPAQQLLAMFRAREVEYLLSRPREEHTGAPVSSSISTSTDAFAILREGSRRAFNEHGSAVLASLPPPAYTIENAKTQLEVDVHEVLDVLGFKSPASQHPMLRKVLKNVVNYCWYVDPHHQRLAALGGRLPKDLAHLALTTYNKYKEKKMKAPRLNFQELEGYVNELYADLTTPALRLPCNVRALSVLTELAHSAAKLLSSMKAQSATQAKYKETQVLNEGTIVMTLHQKLLGPCKQAIERTIVQEMQDKVCLH